MINAAEAAIHDGFLVQFLTNEVGADFDMVNTLLYSFRQYRDKVFHEQIRAMVNHDHDTGS